MNTLDISAFYAGKRYRSVVSEAECHFTPRWNPAGSDAPPCPPQQAIEVAEAFIGAHVPTHESTFWGRERLELRPFSTFEVTEPGYWFWIVIHHLHRKGPSSGLWPYFRLLVSMEGKLIEPVITEEDLQWDARERRWETNMLYP